MAHAQFSDATQFGADRIEELIPEGVRDSQPDSAIDIPLIEGLPKLEAVQPTSPDVTFPVKNIVVLNNTVFDNEIIHEQVQFAIGPNISLTDLRQAATNITNLYRESGYPFSKAFIPQQTLENDTVIINIIEGYIGEVEFRGVEVSENSATNRYAETLKQYRPVKMSQLERAVLLINDIEGVQAKAIMSFVKGTPGAVKLILLMDKTDNQAGLFINNRGSEALGPLQTSAFYKRNDLFGFNEQTSFIHLRTPRTNELSFFSFSQSWPVGPGGEMLSYSLRRSDSKPGGPAETFGIKSQSNALNVNFSYPWIRSRGENLVASLIFDMRNSSTEAFDSEIINDHLRYLRTSVKYDKVHHKGVTNASLILSKGLDILDATSADNIKSSRINGKSNGSKIQADISRKQVITDKTTLTVKASGQATPDKLLSAELFGVGGTEFGRAFDFSTVTGDNGYAASAELSYKIPHNIEHINNFEAFTFVDFGAAYDKTEVINDPWKKLASAGIGVDLTAFGILNVRAELAKPLKNQADDPDYGVSAYVSAGVKIDF